MGSPAAQDPAGDLLRGAIARLRVSVMAVVFAFTGGTGLFVATLWLVIRGGPVVGPHMGLLGQFFPGYTVTWGGCIVGFFYGAAVGGAAGWSIAWLYNRIADRRHPTVN